MMIQPMARRIGVQGSWPIKAGLRSPESAGWDAGGWPARFKEGILDSTGDVGSSMDQPTGQHEAHWQSKRLLRQLDRQGCDLVIAVRFHREAAIVALQQSQRNLHSTWANAWPAFSLGPATPFERLHEWLFRPSGRSARILWWRRVGM